jgi:signal peptidase II
VHLAALFIIAAGICVSIDNIFYGGSLDYINLKPLFIFDLKVMYLNCAIFLILYFYYFHERKKVKESVNGDI